MVCDNIQVDNLGETTMREAHQCTNCLTVYDSLDECDQETVTDPYCTGDSPAEVYVTCPKCYSDCIDDIWLCDACDKAPTLDGYEDCAVCILTQQYSHTTEYDAGHFHDAHVWMRANDPGTLCLIEENQARTIDRGRP